MIGAILILSAPLLAERVSYAPHISVRKWMTDSQYRLDTLSGQPYLVEFWATWCPPCVRNVPRMEKLYEDYSSKGLRIIGLSLDNDTRRLEEFVKEHDIAYPIALDAGTDKRYGVSGIPAAFLVDAAGFIVWSGHPASSSLDDAIEKVLENSPPPVLSGISFDEFKDIDGPVEAGKTFKDAFLVLKGYAARENPLKHKAIAIIDTIDTRLKQRIELADKLASIEYYDAAINIYKSVANDYQGSEIAKVAIEKIKEARAKIS
jgi:thiol-disulfide isomerase/thioredoxin